ncbi:MAG: fasciclin domain-containing protein, partial [Deinococcota bacterium]
MKKHRSMWLLVVFSLLLAACSSSSTPEMPTITTQAVNVSYELDASFAAYQRGDINRDGRVSTADLRILSDVLASGDVSGLNDYRRYQADFTCDGILNVEDIREIQDRASSAKDPAEVQICPTEFEVEDGEFIVLISNIGDLPFNGLQILASAGLDVSLIPTIYQTATPTTFVYNIEVAEGVTEGSLSIDGAGLAEVELDLEFEIALGNIAEIVASRPELSVLLDAVLAAGLADALSGDTELTVFAPDNEAFLDLLDELELDSLEALITATGLPFVTEVLSFHVVPGIFTAADLINLINANGGQFIELETLTGGTVTVGLDEGDVILQNFAEVIEPNIEASNGIIHIIDAVLDFAD